MKKSTLLAIVSFVSAQSVFAQIDPKIQNILNQVSPDAIKGNMTFLSDDLLAGRLPGTQGFDLAKKYMEAQFISSGLKPANGKSYIQEVPLARAKVVANESSFVLVDGKKVTSLTYGREFFEYPYFDAAQSAVEAPLVFVGFGVNAPEFKYNDYQNVDVKGKIVVYINGAPNYLPDNEKAFYNTADSKYKEAIKQGAIGIITFSLPNERKSNWDGLVNRNKNGTVKWVNADQTAGNSYPELKAVAQFNNENLDLLFEHAKTSITELKELADQGKSKSFPLMLSAKMVVKTTIEKIPSANVMGYVEGSDPKLKNEYVVYTAHLDHLGVGKAIKGDSIYNGAHDDASGLAILLQIVKAYQSLPLRPKRSIIFAGVTGEEMGLLGSDYFVNHFPMKDGKIIANLAIDMPFFFHPVLDIVPYGADHSSLGIQTKKAADMLDLKISPDPFPEQVVFIRSDHYSFIKKGIPALFIKSGFMSTAGDPTDWSKADVAWRSTTYHTPQDDMSQAFDFNAATMHVKVNFLIGYMVANDDTAPYWNKGDFFGNKLSK
nr:M28 family peptidase [Pseudopedobacter sp.]